MIYRREAIWTRRDGLLFYIIEQRYEKIAHTTSIGGLINPDTLGKQS